PAPTSSNVRTIGRSGVGLPGGSGAEWACGSDVSNAVRRRVRRSEWRTSSRPRRSSALGGTGGLHAEDCPDAWTPIPSRARRKDAGARRVGDTKRAFLDPDTARTMTRALYDSIGVGYAGPRRQDPRIGRGSAAARAAGPPDAA